MLFSCQVMSDSLRPHELQHARPPCPSSSPQACSNSCPPSQWCHLILCCPLLLLPSIFPSSKVFPNELALRLRWWQYWCFNFSISPSNEYSGLISSRTDWFNLLVVQGIIKSLLQHHNSKASILWLSAFFMVQFSHPYTATGKTIPLIIQTSVGKMMSLLLLRANHRKRGQQRQLTEVVRMRGGKVELSSITETRERATQEGGGSS